MMIGPFLSIDPGDENWKLSFDARLVMSDPKVDIMPTSTPPRMEQNKIFKFVIK